MSESEPVANSARHARKIKWALVFLALLLVATVVMNLPRGFGDDLTRIGKGKAAVVLVRDKDSVESFNLMETLNKVRDRFNGNVEFLLTDFNTPEGRAFMSQYGAQRITAVVFDANGNKVTVLSPSQTADSMQQAIAAGLQGAR